MSHPRQHSRALRAAAALMLLTGATCFGAHAQSCIPSLASGFGGDPSAVYPASQERSDGGGVAIGPGGLNVTGALVTVTRVADGSVLGSATTDDARGLATLVACPGDLPVLITLTAPAGSTYVDPLTGQAATLPAEHTLHALVDTLDENVGVSPLTEAAYRYALNNLLRDADAVRVGNAPMATMGDVRGLTAEQVRLPNRAILAEINRLQSNGLKLPSIKALPSPLDASKSATILPDDRYGVTATVLAGLTAIGGTYGADALAAGEQLARDLTDGRMDALALDGTPAAAADRTAYDAVRAPIAAAVGANRVAARFGASTILKRSPEVAELSRMSLQQDGDINSLCLQGGETSTLLSDGTVSVTRSGCGHDAKLANFASNVQLIEGSGLGEAPRTFVVKTDGTLWGWGDTRCGLLGNDTLAPKFQSTPVQLPGIGNVTAVAIGSWFALARTADGGVYGWGINYEGELGMGAGANAPGAASCDNGYYPRGFAYRTEASIARPTRIPGLANIVSVAADRVTAYALDAQGTVYEWGLIPIDPDPQPFGTFRTQALPAKVQGLPPRIVAIASSYYMKMALTANGQLYGFGPNIVGNFGDGTLNARLTPARVPGLSGVVEIAASGDSPFVALLPDGTIRYWGGCCAFDGVPVPAYVRTTPTAPGRGRTPLYNSSFGLHMGSLPPIRHVKGSGGSVLLYGANGTIYQFPKSRSEPVFLQLELGSGAAIATAVEYRHSGFDHYFVTSNADEIADLDNGVFGGWTRTGESMRVLAEKASGDARAADVCRFFSSAFAPASSHFYTANPAECASLQGSPDWQFEGIVFDVSAPDAMGNCAAGTKAVYRLYNDGRGGVPNHRFTTNARTRDAMVASGWVSEGYGPQGVAMCAAD